MSLQERESKIEGAQKGGEQPRETPEEVARREAQGTKERAAAASMVGAEEDTWGISISGAGGQNAEQRRMSEFTNVEGLENTMRELDANIHARKTEIADIDNQLFDKKKFDAGWRRGEREALQRRQNQLKEQLAAVRRDRDEANARLDKFREKSQ